MSRATNEQTLRNLKLHELTLLARAGDAGAVAFLCEHGPDLVVALEDRLNDDEFERRIDDCTNAYNEGMDTFAAQLQRKHRDRIIAAKRDLEVYVGCGSDIARRAMALITDLEAALADPWGQFDEDDRAERDEKIEALRDPPPAPGPCRYCLIMEGALAWYASAKAWGRTHSPIGMGPVRAVADHGRRARAALKAAGRGPEAATPELVDVDRLPRDPGQSIEEAVDFDGLPTG